MNNSAAFKGLGPPIGKHREILEYVLEPTGKLKLVDVCCGIGFGKTCLAIQAAALALNYDGNQRGLFLEPDWDRVKSIFLQGWRDYIPEHLYTIRSGDSAIEWYNGSYMLYRPRVVTGSLGRSRDKFRGIEFTWVIDDEAAIGFDTRRYTNTMARIRKSSDLKFFFTLSTPKLGEYGDFIQRNGVKLFKGRTRDNAWLMEADPDYDKNLRSTMSPNEAARELDGELVALEGKIWNTWENKPWPSGNLFHRGFDKSRPWYLFLDLGVANAAYVVVQRFPGQTMSGVRVTDEGIWVAVAQLLPKYDGSAARACRLLKQHFGTPCQVVTGADVNTRSNADADTAMYFITQVFGSIPVLPITGFEADKQIQHDKLQFLISSCDGLRRFCCSDKIMTIEDDTRQRRGIREMMDQDEWPDTDTKRPTSFFPKDGRLEHVRDALLYGAVGVMSPPSLEQRSRRVAA